MINVDYSEADTGKFLMQRRAINKNCDEKENKGQTQVKSIKNLKQYYTYWPTMFVFKKH